METRQKVVGMQTIIRTSKNKHFVTIDNRVLRDRRLSWKARGILAYFLTHVDDWEINKQDIRNAGHEGRDAIDAAFNELKAVGYLTFTQERDKNGKVCKAVYTIHEKPLTGYPETGKPLPAKPDSGKPLSGKPDSGNQQQRIPSLRKPSEEVPSVDAETDKKITQYQAYIFNKIQPLYAKHDLMPNVDNYVSRTLISDYIDVITEQSIDDFFTKKEGNLKQKYFTGQYDDFRDHFANIRAGSAQPKYAKHPAQIEAERIAKEMAVERAKRRSESQKTGA